MINGMDYPIIRRMHLTVLLPPMISIMFFAMGHIKPRTLYAAVIDGEAVAVYCPCAVGPAAVYAVVCVHIKAGCSLGVRHGFRDSTVGAVCENIH